VIVRIALFIANNCRSGTDYSFQPIVHLLCSMISYWHDSVVCPSVCPCVHLWRSVLWRTGSLYRGL